jgi:F-type H+-transporting ATPase subunit b
MEIDLNIFLLQLVTFCLGMFISAKLFLPYLRGWMEKRKKHIADQILNAEILQEEAAKLKEDLVWKLKDLDRNSADIIRAARNEAETIKEEIVQSSRREAKRILTEARQALESERRELSQSLQNEVGALSVAIAEKIMRAAVDQKVQSKLVEESLKELNPSKN